ncbi:MAG: phage major capsid protein [Planctomycetota bacterium]
MGLQAEQIADIVSMVKDAEDRGTYTLLTTELQKYPAMRQLFKGKGRRERGGEQLAFNAMVASNASAQTTSLFAEIDVAQADLFKTGRVPWRHVTNYYAFDEREPVLNSRPDDLVDIVKGRRTDCFVDLAVKFEEWFWETPTMSEAADDAPIYGVQYWCPIVVTTAAGAFQGGNGNATAGVAGLPVATYSKWQNWSAQYTAVSEDDFIAALELATWQCDFTNPVAIPGEVGSNYGFYTTYDTFKSLRDIAKNRNDDLGFDLGPKGVTYMGNEIMAVPYLQTNYAAADPFYGIDWGVFKPTFLRGEWMREVIVKHPGKQHRSVVTFVDSTLNIECKNRRKLFGLAKSALPA